VLPNVQTSATYDCQIRFKKKIKNKKLDGSKQRGLLQPLTSLSEMEAQINKFLLQVFGGP
jgi:hypothetical protein